MTNTSEQSGERDTDAEVMTELEMKRFRDPSFFLTLNTEWQTIAEGTPDNSPQRYDDSTDFSEGFLGVEVLGLIFGTESEGLGKVNTVSVRIKPDSCLGMPGDEVLLIHEAELRDDAVFTPFSQPLFLGYGDILEVKANSNGQATGVLYSRNVWENKGN